ncbi:MAG: hypothetical protein U0R50_03275 [Gaiellales bacterium]
MNVSTEATENSLRRLLVIADGDWAAPHLLPILANRGDAGIEILVVAPDDDGGEGNRKAELTRLVETLRLPGRVVEGMLGSGDSLRSIRDALAGFRADEVVVAVRGADGQHVVHIEIGRDIRTGNRTVHPVREVVAA